MKTQSFPKPKNSVVNKAKRNFANVLKTRRESVKLSQSALADLVGVDRKTINRIENGHFSPNLDTMIRLATVLKLKPAQVISINN